MLLLNSDCINAKTNIRRHILVYSSESGDGGWVTVAQADRNLDVHENVLCTLVREYRNEHNQFFSGKGHRKSTLLEIELPRRDVTSCRGARYPIKVSRLLCLGTRYEVRIHCCALFDLSSDMALRSAGFVVRASMPAQWLIERTHAL